MAETEELRVYELMTRVLMAARHLGRAIDQGVDIEAAQADLISAAIALHIEMDWINQIDLES